MWNSRSPWPLVLALTLATMPVLASFHLMKYEKGLGQDTAGDVYVCVSRTLAPFGNTGQLLKLVPLSAAEGWQMYE
jgi:hypothetical protein